MIATPLHPPSTPGIPRVPLVSRQEFYRHWARLRQPVIFQQGAEGFPATSKWTLDWFRASHGGVTVPVHTGIYQRGTVPGTSERVGTSRMMTLERYIDAILDAEGQESGYLAGNEVFQLIPSLLSDLRFPDFLSAQSFTDRSFWMGKAGAFTQLHVDRAHNMYAQFAGRKRWQLYAPEKSARLRPMTIHWAASSSDFDLEPNGVELTRQAGLEPDYDFIIEPGELLFLPYGWWHRVYTLELSIAANVWWWTVPMVVRHGPEVAWHLVSDRCRETLWRLRGTPDAR